MLDLRRARSTSLRMEPADGRRSSFWIPAFMAAAAASECGAVCETGGDCARVGEVAVGVVAVDGLEGGRLLRSGGMLMAMVHGHRCGDDDVLGLFQCCRWWGGLLAGHGTFVHTSLLPPLGNRLF
jgi:hypothetical protein